MEAEQSADQEREREEADDFSYEFSSNGTRYRLCLPVRGPLGAAGARELASRVVQAHNLPCYLEDELRSQLEEFARDSTLRRWDSEGDRAVKQAGDAATNQVSACSQFKVHF